MISFAFSMRLTRFAAKPKNECAVDLDVELTAIVTEAVCDIGS
jgi:hypothetical protein